MNIEHPSKIAVSNQIVSKYANVAVKIQNEYFNFTIQYEN